MLKRRWKAWVGVAVSVAAIAWAMRGVEWSLVGPALADADWRLLALVFLLAPIVNVWVRAVRCSPFGATLSDSRERANDQSIPASASGGRTPFTNSISFNFGGTRK